MHMSLVFVLSWFLNLVKLPFPFAILGIKLRNKIIQKSRFSLQVMLSQLEILILLLVAAFQQSDAFRVTIVAIRPTLLDGTFQESAYLGVQQLVQDYGVEVDVQFIFIFFVWFFLN